jgi:hypothetical protein
MLIKNLFNISELGFWEITFRVLIVLGCLALARALWLSVWLWLH